MKVGVVFPASQPPSFNYLPNWFPILIQHMKQWGWNDLLMGCCWVTLFAILWISCHGLHNMCSRPSLFFLLLHATPPPHAFFTLPRCCIFPTVSSWPLMRTLLHLASPKLQRFSSCSLFLPFQGLRRLCLSPFSKANPSMCVQLNSFPFLPGSCSMLGLRIQ